MKPYSVEKTDIEVGFNVCHYVQTPRKLDTQAKELVREALSPQSSPCKKTAPRKKTAVTKSKSAKETKSKSGEKTRSNSGSKAKGRNGEKASKEKTRSEACRYSEGAERSRMDVYF